MKARFAALCFAALTALPAIACSSADSTDPGSSASTDGPDVLDAEGKADGVSKPVGTYDLDAPSALGSSDIAFIVLKTDMTVHGMWTSPCHTCTPGQFDGSYKFTKSTTSSKRYIKMELANDTVRYEYKMASGKLKLRKANTGAWFSMVEADAGWCEAPSDCEVQELPQPKCPGHWNCEDSSCSYSECESPTQNACEAAGGTCVGLYPDACANGTVGDANTYSCGGQLGVECCLPKEPVQNPCEAAGGSCVALYPGACADGTVGDANTYSCGGQLGVECCLPTPPDDCRTTGCDADSYCSFCWGQYQCMKSYQAC